MQQVIDYTQFVSLMINKCLNPQFVQYDDEYQLFLQDDLILWDCFISEPADVTDFETNYKAGGNQKNARQVIVNDTGLDTYDYTEKGYQFTTTAVAGAANKFEFSFVYDIIVLGFGMHTSMCSLGDFIRITIDPDGLNDRIVTTFYLDPNFQFRTGPAKFGAKRLVSANTTMELNFRNNSGGNKNLPFWIEYIRPT